MSETEPVRIPHNHSSTISLTSNHQSSQGLAEPLLERNESHDKNEPATKLRTIYVNNEAMNAQFKFKKNKISTTKYNLLTFIPKNLIEQFKRIANLYFLFIAALQLVPGLSPTGRFTTILPLCIVLSCSAVKSAFEDLKRRNSDLVTNAKKTLALRNGRFVTTKWKDVATGDILKIMNKDPFPADILILSTSEDYGICYVETSSLDGETNLKIRRGRPETLNIVSEAEANQFEGTVRCEVPNNRLYNFEGTLHIANEVKLSIDPDNILLRGSSLRNTDWVIGTVIYAGHDSKLMMNTNKTPHKTTRVERLTNKLIFIILALEVLLCLICTVGLMIWTGKKAQAIWYLDIIESDTKLRPRDLVRTGFLGFWTFLILYNNLIPISLYVSIEVAKFIQGNIMSQDLKMYHHESDTPALVRTSALNEELGQVEYIFSDKTGTLTCNKMELLKFAVNGVAYGTGVTEIARAVAKNEGRVIVDDRPADFKPTNGFQFYDARVNNLAWSRLPDSEAIKEFLVLLAVCHTVIPERHPKNPNDVVYQASSPDEAALVKAAKYLGVEFISRTSSEVTIRLFGKDETWSILNVLEFTSARKRQSVVARDPNGKLVLLTKGADNVIFPLMVKDQAYVTETDNLLEEFARDGLRTLVCTKADLAEDDYNKWAEKFKEAKCSFINRSQNIEDVCALIEQNLQLVGITAIEDKLQDGVPATIAELKHAGIKIWVLTGDKRETAINIGFACNLLNNQMVRIIVEGESVEEVKRCILTNLHDTLAAVRAKGEGLNIGMIVEGEQLHYIYEDAELKRKFLELGKLCRAVICCRVSPKQKADVVSLVKGEGKITLAIGDGANDVSMIQAAHVGIGISGEEGLQAANAADYSIAQFRFLKRLLLVHGRWSYRRISKLILYSFYKNIVLYLTQFWFVIYTGFSGTSVHDKWTVSSYNVIFTAVPIMVLAAYDQDISDEIVEEFPELYAQGHSNVFFNKWVFLGWTANSIFHSAVCFFIPAYCLYFSAFSNGQDIDMLALGVTVYTCVVITVTLKCAIEMSSYTWIHWVSLIASVFSWYIFILLYGSIYYLVPFDYFIFNEFYGILQEWRTFGSASFWFTVLLTCTIALLRDFFWKSWIRNTGRNLYYQIQSDAKRKPREDILKYFPLEEGVPLHKPREQLVPLPDIKQFFTTVTKRRHRGFAFSVAENEADLLDEKLGRKQHYLSAFTRKK